LEQGVFYKQATGFWLASMQTHYQAARIGVAQEQKNDDEKKAYCNKQAFETKRKTKALVRINSEGRESPGDHQGQ